jgi:hypothetical protein
MTSRRKSEQKQLQADESANPPSWATVEAALSKLPEALEKLCTEWEGRKLSVPKTAKGSKLEEVIGAEGAEIVCKIAGGIRIVVPTASARESPQRRARIIELRMQGLTHAQIAFKVKCTDRTVFNVLKG